MQRQRWGFGVDARDIRRAAIKLNPALKGSRYVSPTFFRKIYANNNFLMNACTGATMWSTQPLMMLV